MKKDPKISKALKKFLDKPILIDENMTDFSNAPFVLAKKEKAEKLLSKYPVPESFLNKPKTKNKKDKVKSYTPKA